MAPTCMCVVFGVRFFNPGAELSGLLDAFFYAMRFCLVFFFSYHRFVGAGRIAYPGGILWGVCVKGVYNVYVFLCVCMEGENARCNTRNSNG